jgi:hypothetical protein
MDSIRVSVLNRSEPEMHFQLLPTDRITDLKRMIARRIGPGLWGAGFRVAFQGLVLEVERTVQDYGIENGSTIIVAHSHLG